MSEANWRSVTASAPAKVILHGEHSVVYGKLALAASIDLRTKVTIKVTPKRRLVRVYLLNYTKLPLDFDLDILRPLAYNQSETIDENLRADLLRVVCDNCPEEHLGHSEGLVALLYLSVASFHEAGHLLPSVEITVASDIPCGAGLGSSAAFSVASAAALLHLQAGLQHKKRQDGENAILDVICSWAFKSEKIIHGNPSGLDNSICTYGGLMSYATGKSMRPLPAINNGSLRVLLINSCVSRNTKALVAHVKENRVNLMPKVAASILEAMDRVAREAAETITKLLNNNNNDHNKVVPNPNSYSHDKGLFHKLEELIDTNQGLLASLGVSHPALEKIIEIAARQKIHAKLTGAGGGGFAYALITPWHTEDQVSEVKLELESAGFLCWETQLAGDGVKFASLP